MEKYLGPILTATVFFPLLAFLFTVPYMIYSYRKYGSVLITRAVLMYAFIYYLICVYALAILPFPDANTVVTQRTRVNLIPFSYVPEVIAKSTAFDWSDPGSWLPAIYSSGLYEPLCNILMFLPLGVFLRYYFGLTFWKTALIAFLGSLFLELTQLSATYGLAPFVYRCCDVNDLIDNTFGGMVGYWITPLLTWFLPSRERLNQVSYQRGSRVSYVRRFVAFSIDWLADMILELMVSALIPLAGTLKYLLAGLLVAILYHGVLVILWHGRTLGKALVKIRLVDDQTKDTASPRSYMLRGILLWGVLLQSGSWLTLLTEGVPMLSNFSALIGMAGIVVYAVLLFNAVYNGVKNRPQMFYEQQLHLIQVSTVQTKTMQPAAQKSN